jgi:hypothetical protein
MSAEPRVEDLAVAVLSRLLPRLGADGSRGALVVAFTGATVGLDEAIGQTRGLVLRGFQLRLAFSHMAEHLYGDRVREQLAGFPQWEMLPPVAWFRVLHDAKGVVVPMLSVNSLSKIAALLADGQVSNVILHGLFSGKPVVVARNGVERNQGRADLGFHHGSELLWQAIDDRLRLAAGYGCRLADVSQLAAVVDGLVGGGAPASTARQAVLRAPGTVITQGDVSGAHRAGVDLRCAASAVITPLAREAAARLGVRLLREGIG